MQGRLPYINPDLDIDLNVGIALLILNYLSTSARGKLLINIEKLHAFMFLAKNPVVLDKLLIQSSRQGIPLNEIELFSVNSISINFDPLFDQKWIKTLIGFAASKGYIEVEFRKADGFMFNLSHAGKLIADKLNGEYFSLIKKYVDGIGQLKSLSSAELNKLLNSTVRG